MWPKSLLIVFTEEGQFGGYSIIFRIRITIKGDSEPVFFFITFTIFLGFNLCQECFRAKGQCPLFLLAVRRGVTR